MSSEHPPTIVREEQGRSGPDKAANDAGKKLALPSEPKTLLGSRGRLLIGAALLVAALVYFAFTAFEGSAVYYLTVSEALQSDRVQSGTRVRVSGKLVQDSFQREQRGTLARFTITDGEKLLLATYDGVVPDLFFNVHSDIVLEGQRGPDGVFNTETVIVKCPSKYAAASEQN